MGAFCVRNYRVEVVEGIFVICTGFVEHHQKFFVNTEIFSFSFLHRFYFTLPSDHGAGGREVVCVCPTHWNLYRDVERHGVRYLTDVRALTGIPREESYLTVSQLTGHTLKRGSSQKGFWFGTRDYCKDRLLKSSLNFFLGTSSTPITQGVPP